jgi:hypothetical protein
MLRLARAVLFNVYRRTCEVLTGYVFQKDPVLGDDVPPLIREHAENIDQQGTHFDVFARGLLQEALATGHTLIHVEYPNVTGQLVTRADETAGGLRPYWIPVRKEDVLSWRTEVEYGRIVLTQIVLRECHMVPAGAFSEAPQERYRVLRRTTGPVGPVVSWSLLEIGKDRRVFEVGVGTYPTQTEIPVAEIVTSGYRSLLASDPPLLDLAHLNLAHYQQWSDVATSIHKTCVPILFTKGFIMRDEQGHPIVVGPNAGLNSENPEGDAKYVVHDGASLGSCRQALEDLKTEMATLGVAMLASDKRVAETAEAKRIGKSASDSSLAVTARGLQDGLERALGFHAHYMGLDDGGSVKINRDFHLPTLQADLLSAITATVTQAGVPERVLLQNMQEGGLIAPDEDLDAMELEMVAGQAAIEEQKRLQAAETATTMAGRGGTMDESE